MPPSPFPRPVSPAAMAPAESPSGKSPSSRREWLSQVALSATVLAGGLALPGCEPQPVAGPSAGPTTANPGEKPLRLLVLDDVPLGKALAANWRSQTEKELTVTNLTSVELHKTFRLPADVVVFPTALLGTLAERELISPLSPSFLAESIEDYRDLFPHVRLRETTWGSKPYALPLGSPQWMLVYRLDIFERLGLAVPKNWTEYQTLVEKLASREVVGDLAPAEDQPWQATCEPLAPGWAGQLLLARSAGYAADPELVSPLFSLDNLQPLVNSPPYLRALQELLAAAKVSGPESLQKTPTEAYGEILAGRCGMAITWPTVGLSPDSVASGASEAIAAKLGYALLPTGNAFFRFEQKQWQERATDTQSPVPLLASTGRLISVSSTANQPQQALNFMGKISKAEVTVRLASASAAISPLRELEAPTASRWLPKGSSPASASQFFTVLATTQRSSQSLTTLRLPGSLEYGASLDEAIARAIAGTTAEDALGTVVQRWQEITAARGISAQKLALLHSLGITATGR